MKAGGFPEGARREPEREYSREGEFMVGCVLAVPGTGEHRVLPDGICGTRTERWPGRGVPLPSGGKDSTQVTLCPQNHEFLWRGGVILGEGEGSKGQGATPGARGKKRKGRKEEKPNRPARNLPSR